MHSGMSMQTSMPLMVRSISGISSSLPPLLLYFYSQFSMHYYVQACTELLYYIGGCSAVCSAAYGTGFYILIEDHCQ